MTATPHIDPTTAGMMAAIEAGLDDKDQEEYGRFIEEGGVDPIDAVDVIARAIDQQHYREAIAVGATHQEILELVDILYDDVGTPIKHYREAIEAGATHKQILEAMGVFTYGPSAAGLKHYREAIKAGATPKQILEVMPRPERAIR